MKVKQLRNNQDTHRGTRAGGRGGEGRAGGEENPDTRVKFTGSREGNLQQQQRNKPKQFVIY